ncbi:MAG: NAD(P)-dependent oxidoreductase [Roseburia sp.]|nr:NAD(P)-dependent oxidoreductase [Roseburia sp.]
MDLVELEGSKILITGASGLIGKSLVKSLILRRTQEPIEVIALVRNKEKAVQAFCDLPQEHLHYLLCDVCNFKAENLGVNYIIHCASKTSSKDFVSTPVEVILNSVCGTKNLLEFARVNPVNGFVYLSTMEIYGTPQTDDKITENHPSNIDTMSVRSSYPESKRLCEAMCAAYFSEYNVPAKVVRLTQTFGEGIDYNDKRVFAEFARCLIEKRDIILKTKGETKRNYICTDDAVNAILTVLIKGASGEAYNVANEDTYCSIYEMANMMAANFGEGVVNVKIEETADVEKLGYAKTLKMNLSTDKLRALGWKAETDLITAFEKMISSLRQSGKKYNKGY